MKVGKFRFGMAIVVVALVVPAVAVAVSPFVDVLPGKFYEAPVEWAFNNGITTGRDSTHFDPDGVVTRGETVTFLKRYNDNIMGQTVGQIDCTAGQVAKFDGDDSACGTDNTIPDTDTDTLAGLGCTSDQVAHFDGADWVCGAISLSTTVGVDTVTTVDAGGSVGLYTSVAIGADDLAIISYNDGSNGDLKVAHLESVITGIAFG